MAVEVEEEDGLLWGQIEAAFTERDRNFMGTSRLASLGSIAPAGLVKEGSSLGGEVSAADDEIASSKAAAST